MPKWDKTPVSLVQYLAHVRCRPMVMLRLPSSPAMPCHAHDPVPYLGVALSNPHSFFLSQTHALSCLAASSTIGSTRILLGCEDNPLPRERYGAGKGRGSTGI